MESQTQGAGRPVAITTTGSSEQPKRRRNRRPWTFVGFALALVAVAVAGFVIGNRSRDGAVRTDESLPPAPADSAPVVDDVAVAPATTLAAAPATTLAEGPSTTLAAGPATTLAEAPVADPDPNADVPSSSLPEPGAELDEPGVSPVAESKATIRNGQIFLEGAVPTQGDGDAIAALAAEILGEENVFNNYVVDPAAGDPSEGNITVEDTINFRSDSAEILPDGEGLLNQALALFTIRPAVTATIVGHTDDRGTEESNRVLSLARADAVKQWFVDRGVDPARLSTEGAGELQPIASNDTADGQRQNRRIQFFLQNVLSG